jgi:PilZ domain
MAELDQTPAPRIPLKLDVEYRKIYGRSPEVGALKNISISGAFLEHSDRTLAVNDRLAITFKVGGRVRKINAVVIWSNSEGAGIHFRPANNRDLQIIDDLMYFVESKRENRRSVLDDIFKKAA